MSTPAKRIVRIKNFTTDVSTALRHGSMGGRTAVRGDNAFRELMFGTKDPSQPRVVSERVAVSIGRGGFHCEDGTEHNSRAGVLHSLASLCFEHGRADLLREVALASRQPVVDGWATGTGAHWLAYLGMYKNYAGVPIARSLVSIATDVIRPHSEAFIRLALELDPKSNAIAHLMSRGGPAAALIVEAQMRMQMEATKAAAPAMAEKASEPAPRPRMAAAI